MSERDEIRRLQQIRYRMDESVVMDSASTKSAIDDALWYMRRLQARADLAAEREREAYERIEQLKARIARLEHALTGLYESVNMEPYDVVPGMYQTQQAGQILNEHPRQSVAEIEVRVLGDAIEEIDPDDQGRHAIAALERRAARIRSEADEESNE